MMSTTKPLIDQLIGCRFQRENITIGRECLFGEAVDGDVIHVSDLFNFKPSLSAWSRRSSL